MALLFWLVRFIFSSHAALVAENILLRHQLAVLQRSVKRPRLTRRDRLVLRRWRESLVIMKPETVAGWHRAGFRLFWRWKSRGGRPAIRTDLRALIRRIAVENPLWGKLRIQAELAMLGHKISRSTVSKYLGIRPRGSPTWRTFIRNHMDCTAAMDFFTVPTINGRVLDVFVVLHHARRKIVHFNVTAHPTAERVVRQLREVFPFDSAPRFLIHDNDSIFGEAIAQCIRSLGITEVLTSLGSPWHNSYAERVIGTIRRECLDHVVVLNDAHPIRVVVSFLSYCRGSHCHRPLSGELPAMARSLRYR